MISCERKYKQSHGSIQPMAKTRPEVTELPAQNVGFLFGTMMDLRMLPSELKHTGKVAQGEFKIVAHFPAKHAQDGTEAAYLARHRTFRGGLYATYHDGPYTIDETNWDATGRAGVHIVTMTKYGQVVEFPSQPSKTMPGSMKLMVQEYVESLKVPGFVIRCSGLGGALEPIKGKAKEYEVVLLSGDVKCPKKLANHVPAKYHAEDESIFLAQGGPWCGNFNAPYAGSDALSAVNVSQEQLTNTVGSGDFDHASLNSSGHMDIFANAESYEYGLGEYYEEDPDNWAHWDKYRIRHDIVNAIKQMPTDKAWEYITGLREEDEDPELDDEYDLHEKNKDLDAALKNLIIERDYIQEPQGTGILNELSAKNYYKNAESFAAASTAMPDLKREKRNVLAEVQDRDPNFTWAQCTWGPYWYRYHAEGSNKFYAVWAWERSPGITTAMGAYGGLGQKPRLINVNQSRNKQQAINEAIKKAGAKQKKGYQTYTAEDTYAKPPWIKGPGRRTRAMRAAKKAKNMQLREKRAEYAILGDSAFPVVPNAYGEDSDLSGGRGVPQWYGAEQYPIVNPMVYEEVGGRDALGVGLPVIGNDYGQDSAGGIGRGAPEWYGAESAFDKLANKVAQGYIKKGKSRKEAMEIGRRTAYKIGVRKYGKKGMAAKSQEGRRLAAKRAEEFAAMSRHKPSKADVDAVVNAIRSRYKGVRIKGRPNYITDQSGSSNKYHVFVMTNKGGFNGYGRIGSTMTLYGPMGISEYNRKESQKMRKGYKETRY